MGFIKELWSDLIYQALYEDPDLNTMFNRSMEQEIRTGGNKLHIPTLASGVSVQRTDNKSVGNGLPLTINDINKDEKSFDIYEYSTEPIVIRNIDKVQANRNLLNDNIQEIKQIFKEHILETIFTHIINNVAAAHKIPWTGSTGTSLAALDLATMETTLDNVPILENDRYAMFKSNEQLSLITETGMKEYFAIQQTNILKGILPQLFGFGLKKTTKIPLTKADGTIDVGTPANNVKRNVVGWRRQYMHLVVQTEFEITASERAEYLGNVASFTNRYGVFLERENGAVQATQQ